MTWITQRIEFDSGHRVLGHGGKCRHLHGHRYVAEITFEATKLNDLGMVIDFGDVKRIIGSWINEHWDHNMILNSEDPLASSDINTVALVGREPFIMSVNPTAENMAAFLFYQSKDLLAMEEIDVRVVNVTIYETPNCRAAYGAHCEGKSTEARESGQS